MENTTDTPAAKEFEFLKYKMIGTVNYKSLHSKVTVDSENVTVTKQTKILALIPLGKKTWVIPRNKIRMATIRNRLDIIDGIYCLFFAGAGLVFLFISIIPALLLLLIAGLCLFTGFGQVIQVDSETIPPLKLATADQKTGSELVDLLMQKSEA